MENLNDITLVLCVDQQHLEELKFAWKTWQFFKPEIVELRNKILLYDQDIENVIPSLSFIDDSFTTYRFVNRKYYSSQRDAMLTAWFEAVRSVKTKFYLKIDTDCFATNHNKDWISAIQDRNNYKIISNRWGYTKNPQRLISLDDWGDSAQHTKDYPRLNFMPKEGSNKIIHSRIISFFGIFDTDWTHMISESCWKNDHYELPDPSQDTFTWYCAERRGDPIKTIRFKDYGFAHTKLCKAKSQIKMIDKQNIKLNVGCGRKKYEDWTNIDKSDLDITKEADWLKNNLQYSGVHRILAEHVFEHLDNSDRHLAIENLKKFIHPNGLIRIAVPDGNHPDESYINNVKVNGLGPSADDHKYLYDYKQLVDLFAQYGFKHKLLEYFDEFKQFHAIQWNIEDGFIKRSSKFDRRNKKKKLTYTSLIVDFFL